MGPIKTRDVWGMHGCRTFLKEDKYFFFKNKKKKKGSMKPNYICRASRKRLRILIWFTVQRSTRVLGGCVHINTCNVILSSHGPLVTHFTHWSLLGNIWATFGKAVNIRELFENKIRQRKRRKSLKGNVKM